MSNLPTAQWFTELITAGGGESAPPAPIDYMTRLNGVNSYIGLPGIPVEAGIPFEIDFLGLANDTGSTWILAEGTNPIVTTRPTLEVTTGTAIKYQGSTFSEVRLDGDLVTSNVTPAPTDGQIHTLRCIPVVRTDLGVLGAFWTRTVLFAATAITRLTVDDGSVWNFKLNEPWNTDTPRIAYNDAPNSDGPELLTNHDFSNNTVGWAVSGAWSVENGKLVTPPEGLSSGDVVQDITVIDNTKQHTLRLSVEDVTAGELDFFVYADNNVVSVFSLGSSSGTYDKLINFTGNIGSASNRVYFRPKGTFIGKVNVVSLFTSTNAEYVNTVEADVEVRP